MQRRTNLARAVRAALVLQFWNPFIGVHAQGLNNLWTGGYASWAGLPYGGIDIDFQGNNAAISYVVREMDYMTTVANITSTAGPLLFSTNGIRVADASGATMYNGGGLNPGDYADSCPYGLFIPQGALILPYPEDPSIYLLFHTTVDDFATATASQLYLTTIDMSLNDGIGGVVSKNQPILVDDLNVGRLAAVRHANGRDWWVFCHKIDTDIHYRLLVTPAGVAIDGSQAIGIVRSSEAGQACFSPDGSRFAYYWGEDADLDIFRFDRCTGLFFDPIYVPVDDELVGGVSFSPSGRYAYVSSTLDVYQVDTEAPDVPSSIVHIAHWDSTYSPSPPLATYFSISQLAPDGKIYIGTGNGTLHLHVIHAPDSAGLACDLEQHGLELPAFNADALPNHPNYHLGPVVGSVCDSLDLGTGMAAQQVQLGAQAYPNPSNGQFNLSYPVQPEAGTLEVLDMQGRVVYQSRLAAWSQVHAVGLEGKAEGMYHCRLTWGARSASTRIIITEP
ncbi:MAG: T9SS type A sorting domain-containing protein [Flavobacteriales bacterium]|jgi:hypothetical protein|nr:T9SS type A sorting domain-containing protein [Flavobacteriales bacterium]